MVQPLSTLLVLVLITIIAARHYPKHFRYLPEQNPRNTRFAPFIAQIYNRNIRSCIGAIIHRYFIATTAHCCVSQLEKNYSSVRIGTIYYGQGYMVDVTDIHQHKLYVPERKINDICVIKLAKRLEWSDDIQPLLLPRDRLPVPDAILLYTWKSQPTTIDELQLIEAQFHHYDHYKCQRHLEADRTMLCANINSNEITDDIKTIDMGAPIQRNGYLYGLASMNLDWNLITAPILIFTDVYELKQFIEDIIKSYFNGSEE